MSSEPPEVVQSLADYVGIGGKVALVTGAAGGCGRAAALQLARAGAALVVADVDAHAVAAVAGHIAAEGGDAIAVTVDVTQESSVLFLFAAVLKAYGRLDILVNGHTLVGSMALTETTVAQWDRMHAVNLRGAFLCMREAIRLMQGQGEGGRIISITSVGAVHPVLNGNGAYSSSKAGLNMLTRNAALDYAADGITVNAVLAGAIPPDAHTPRMGAANRSGSGADAARHLCGVGKPEAVAAAVLYLASAPAAHVTGQLLAVDGGFLVS